MIKLKGRFKGSFENVYPKPLSDADWKQRSSARFSRSGIPYLHEGLSTEPSDTNSESATSKKTFEATRLFIIATCTDVINNGPICKFSRDGRTLYSGLDPVLIDYLEVICNADPPHPVEQTEINAVVPQTLTSISQLHFPTHEARKYHARLLRDLAGPQSITDTFSERAAVILEEIVCDWSNESLSVHELWDKLISNCEALLRLCSNLGEVLISIVRDLPSTSLALWKPILVPVLRYISHRLKSVRTALSRDTSPAADRITGTYDPAKYGMAYHFTPHGERVRNLQFIRGLDQDPNAPKKKGAVSDIYDDRPGGAEECKKVYTRTKNGDSYLFVAHCLVHEQCVGWHIVDGMEGRKDVHLAVYTHAPVAPRRIFYDFCCSCSEYCLNRAGDFYKSSRFFHDVSHPYSRVVFFRTSPNLHLQVEREVAFINGAVFPWVYTLVLFLL